MEYLLGDFTIKSGENPAIFQTTFPRAVNLDDGLEIGIKSIVYGPVKNLLYPIIQLCNLDSRWNLELADRFYESQSDILLEVHRQILMINNNVSNVKEKNSEITLELFDGFYLEFHEDMFLNRPFKYKSVNGTKRKRELSYTMTDSKRKKDKATKKAPLVETIARKDLPEKFGELQTKVDSLDKSWTDLKKQLGRYPFRGATDLQTLDVIKIKTGLYKILEEDDGKIKAALYEILEGEFSEMTKNINQSNEKLEAFKQLLETKESQLSDLNGNLAKVLQLETRVTNSQKDIDTFRAEVTALAVSIGALGNSINDTKGLATNIIDLQSKFVSTKAAVDAQQQRLTSFESEVNKFKRNLVDRQEEILDFISDKLGYDQDHIFASDTSNFSSSAKDKIYATDVTVSKTILPSFEIAFLYGDMIERSWMNNKETRLLTTMPLKCHRGYNYYEFKNPVYKKIRVLKFDQLYFYIFDKTGKEMKFNLYGDGTGETREFPTILNLHVRKAIKG